MPSDCSEDQLACLPPMPSPHICLSLSDMGFRWGPGCSECGVECVAGLNRSACVHSRVVLSCWVLLGAFILLWLWRCSVKIDCGNQLYAWVCSLLPSQGLGEESVISFPHRSPISNSVLLSLFPKSPFISPPCLGWKPVSAAQFWLLCLEAVVKVCFL